MISIKQILDFFVANNCQIEIEYGSKMITLFNIWSNVSKRWILQNANEAQLRNFYKNIIK